MDPSSPSPRPKVSLSGGLPATLPPPLARPTSDSALSTIRSATKRKTSRKISSRNRRARSASSGAGSLDGSDFSMEDYSIDLAKLGEKDSSWTIGKAGERDIERLSSRDEGPEDFTMRMGDWMRGTMPWKPQPASKDEPHKDRRSSINSEDRKTEFDDKTQEAAVPLEGNRVGDPGQAIYEADDEDEIVPLSTSTPAPGMLQEISKRSSAPPFSRMNTEAIQDRATQEVFDQISALQAEVERLRLENKDHLSAQAAVQHVTLQQQKECRILRTQLDDLRSEAKRLQDSEFKANQKVLRLEQELKKDGSKVGSLRAKFEPVVAELETIKLRAEADKQAADSTINALKADIKSSKDMTAKLQAERSIAASAHAAAFETVKAEMKAEMEAGRTKYQHREDILKEQLQAKENALHSSKETDTKMASAESLKTELEHTKEQLQESRRIIQNIEDENELLAQESERQNDEIASLKRALDEERLQVASAADAEIAELQDEITRMQAQKTADMITYSEHTSALSQLADDHAAATEALTTKHKQELHVLRTAIIKAGEGMKKREERFAIAHERETSKLQTQIKTLQEQSKSAKPTPSKPTVLNDEQNPTVVELRSALQALNNRLSTTIKARDAAHADAEKYHNQCRQLVQKANTNINHLKSELVRANAEVDQRMAKKMEDREREWRRRIKIMFKEREQMGNALMEMWGREECGKAKEGEKQKYRYRYFDKEGRFVEEGLW
ncbi:MAG: hypothetical protein L6R40_004602 [Gallowayella cf. fulva]|nr:MAG: hypothetical protein L6R40_004602 [Xanthomendoza cf. fulva]